MTATLNAAADEVQGRVILDLTIDGATSATVVRVDPDNRPRPVRNTEPVLLSEGRWVGYDYEAPPGVELTYVATSGQTNASVSTTVITGDIPGKRTWLKHPLKPSLNLLLDAVAGVPSKTRPARRVLLQPINADTVAYTMRRAAGGGVLSLMSATNAEREALDALLDDGAVLLLQPPANFGLPSMWVSFDTTQEDRRSQIRGADPTRVWSLPFDIVRRPAGSASGGLGNTYDDIPVVYATYDDLATSGRTYDDLELSVRPPDLDPGRPMRNSYDDIPIVYPTYTALAASGRTYDGLAASVRPT